MPFPPTAAASDRGIAVPFAGDNRADVLRWQHQLGHGLIGTSSLTDPAVVARRAIRAAQFERLRTVALMGGWL